MGSSFNFIIHRLPKWTKTLAVCLHSMSESQKIISLATESNPFQYTKETRNQATIHVPTYLSIIIKMKAQSVV